MGKGKTVIEQPERLNLGEEISSYGCNIDPAYG